MTFLILMLHIVSLTAGKIITNEGVFWVPIVEERSWKKAHPSDLVCPPVSQIIRLENPITEQVEVQIPSGLRKTIISDGYLCYGLIYMTECSTSFFGTEEIKQTITHKPVDRVVCKTTIDMFNNGEYVSPYFPEPVCSWMRSTKVTAEFVGLTRHPVKVDPYTGTFIDGLFSTVNCDEQVCPTIHANTIWVGNNYPQKICHVFSSMLITVMRSNSISSDDVWIKLGPGEIYNLNQSCKMIYCGVSGVKLINGHFVGINHPKTKNVKFCDDHDQITIETVEGVSMENKRILEDVQLRLDCIETIQDLRSGGMITYSKLSKFQPMHPGIYPVYRINNKVLEHTTGQYVGLQRLSLTKPYSLGYINDTSKFVVKAVDSGDNMTYSAFNGVHTYKNGTVIIPDLEMLKNRYSETLMYLHSQIQVDHPYVQNHPVGEVSNQNGMTYTSNSNGFWTKFEKFFETVWGKVVTILSLIMALVVISLLLICIGPRLIKLIHSKNSVSPQSIEMRDSHNHSENHNNRIDW